MPGRKFTSTTNYKYGFNGKEEDDEVKGDGNQQDYGMRIYDPRIAKFLSVDPLTKEYPELTPYQFASNSPIAGIDRDGLEFEDHRNLLIKNRPVQNNVNQQTTKGLILVNKQLACHDPNFKIPTYRNNESFKQWIKKGYIRNFTYHFGKSVVNTVKTLGTPSKSEYGGSSASDDYGELGSNVEEGIKQTIDNLVSGDPEKVAEATGNIAVGYILSGAKAGKPSRISAVEENGYAIVRDAVGNEAGSGWLFDGELNLSIKTTGTALKGRGSDVFRALYDFINTNFETITSIRGTWRPGELSSNLKQFNQYISEGYSASEASMRTFTGINAENLGFKKAKVLESSMKNKDGSYQTVDVIFTKE